MAPSAEGNTPMSGGEKDRQCWQDEKVHSDLSYVGDDSILDSQSNQIRGSSLRSGRNPKGNN